MPQVVCAVDWNMTLEYLKVFLSWPVVVLALGLLFLYNFKHQISNFLSRVTEGEAYGMKFKANSPQDSALTTDTEHVIPENDAIKWVTENPEKAIEEYNRVNNSYKWERAMNFIYGTQIDLLDALSKRGDVGELYVNLAFFLDEHQKRIGNSSYQMADYLNFLQLLGFVISEGDSNNLRIKITPYGLSFLSYIKASYADTWNKKPY